jgi:PAS domain S-box-containing protein
MRGKMNIGMVHSDGLPDAADPGRITPGRDEYVDGIVVDDRWFRVLFEGLPDAAMISRLHDDGRLEFLKANEEAVARYGYSHEEFVRMSPHHIVKPGSVSPDRFIEDLLDSGRASTDVTHVAKNGREIPVIVDARLIQFDGESLVISVCRDVAQRERMVAQRQQEHLWEAIGNAPIVVSSQGKDLRYDFIFNPIFGIDPESGRGMRADELAGGRPEAVGIEKVMAFQQNVLDTGQPARATFSLGIGDIARQFDIVSQPRRDDDGEVIGVVSVSVDVTARARSEAALRLSEERFRALAAAMPQLVWTAESDGTIVYFNRRIALYGGHALADEGWDWSAMIHPDDLDKTVATWQAAVRTGIPYAIEHRIRMEDGTFRWHLSRSEPARDDSGDVVRWFGTSTDVHDLKLAQSEAREARDRLAIALQAAEMGMWTSDVSGARTLRNLRHDQIFGYEDLQPSWNVEVARRHVIPEDLPAFDRGLAESAETGVLRHEIRVRWPNGSVRWIFSLGRFYHDDHGERLGMAGVVMDITERKLAEEALRELNDRLEEEVASRTAELVSTRDHFRTTFHASPVATAIERLSDGVLLDVNAEFVRVFGITPEIVDGHVRPSGPLEIWVNPADHGQLVEDAAHRRSVRDREVSVFRSPGEVRIMLVSVEHMAVDGEPAALMMFLDITERKLAEEAVRQLSTALTLAEQRERRRISEVLHDDVQQILFGVDMRAAVLEHALATVDPPSLADLAGHVQEVRGLLAEAVRSTRVLSLELNPPVLRGEGLRPALTWLARHMEEMHGLEVSLEIDDPLTLQGEDQRVLVVQLARELLFNVVKHAGVSRARLAARREAGSLVILVEDDGLGFDVVEGFETSLHRDSLGLFSVHERVRLFNGTFKINSSPGEGTCVRLELPMRTPLAAT